MEGERPREPLRPECASREQGASLREIRAQRALGFHAPERDDLSLHRHKGGGDIALQEAPFSLPSATYKS